MSCNAKKDPNGTWRIQYRWTDWTGTKKKSQKRGFKTKKEAEEWYAHFMLQQSSDPTMTLADFWEIYKADMEKRLRKTTMKQKEYVMNDKVLPYFGKTPINEITAPMIRKWQGEMMEKGFKITYLKTIHNQLSAILNYAVNFYDLRSNPCRKAGSMGKSKADERPYWTLEEFQKFSDVIIGKLKEHLLMVQEQAELQFDVLVEQMAEREGVTEQFKEENQMLWVQRMDNIRARVEEVVREEIIYCNG